MTPMLVGQTAPRLDLATRQIWSSKGLVSTAITGRLVNDSSVAPPIITLIQPANGPLNGGVSITGMQRTRRLSRRLLSSPVCFVCRVPAQCTARTSTSPMRRFRF